MKQPDKRKKLKQIRWMRIKYKINCLLGRNHQDYLRKHDVFGEFGKKVLYQPDYLPNNPKLVKIHNNVWIASGVTFYEHDVINAVFENMDKTKYNGHSSCIEILDNVFIGGKSIIVGNVKIGPNAIIGAGSVVTKDVEEGTIVAGNPAVVIGKFEDLHKRRFELYAKNNIVEDDAQRNKRLWDKFYSRYNKKV